MLSSDSIADGNKYFVLKNLSVLLFSGDLSKGLPQFEYLLSLFSFQTGSYGVRTGVRRQCQRILSRCGYVYRGLHILQDTENDWRGNSY